MLNEAKTNPDTYNNKTGLGTKREEIIVHPMPSKFVMAANQKSKMASSKTGGGNAKKLILVAIALVLLIIIVIAAVLFFTNKNAQTPEPQQEAIINENTNEVMVEDNTNQVVEIINENTNEVMVEDNTNQVVEIINENTNENINDIVDVPKVADADNDGLSYEEELVFGTNPDLEDTDRDGYKDGQEITSLYDPLSPNKGLAESGLVTKFTNGSYKYTFLRPSAWLVNFEFDTPSNIVILPNSETGETFSIKVTNNTNNLSLAEALNAMSGVLGSAINYQNYSLSDTPAYRSLDSRKVLVVKDNFIFVISHDISPMGAVNFSSIFEMMLNSFEFSPTVTPEGNV